MQPAAVGNHVGNGGARKLTLGKNCLGKMRNARATEASDRMVVFPQLCGRWCGTSISAAARSGNNCVNCAGEALAMSSR